MRKTKIVIPIYFGTLTLIQSKDLKKVFDKYNLDDYDGAEAVAFWQKSKKGRPAYAIAFSKNTSNSTIAHECMHIVNRIFSDGGIFPDPLNDEPQCYLLGWLVDECDEFLNNN